jgi:hypothetical protein
MGGGVDRDPVAHDTGRDLHLDVEGVREVLHGVGVRDTACAPFDGAVEGSLKCRTARTRRVLRGSVNDLASSTVPITATTSATIRQLTVDNPVYRSDGSSRWRNFQPWLI